MFWVLKRTVSISSFEHPKHMVKLIGKKMITILHSKGLINLTYGFTSFLFSVFQVRQISVPDKSVYFSLQL